MLVCGIAYLHNGIGICMSQFTKLVLRCKSTVNIGFKSAGYEIVKTNMYQAAELMKMFPSQMKNSQESRKWAIRCLNDTNHEETKKIFDEQNEIDLFDEFGQDELIDDIEFPFF